MHPHFFLTGGTGLIGRNLLPRLLRAFPESRVTLLVRGRDEDAAQERLAGIIGDLVEAKGIASAPGRLRGVRGNVELHDLGITPDDLERIVAETTHIIHGAATIRFDNTMDEARRINCGGTERMLRLASRCSREGRLDRFLYIGTSSVSGRREGAIYEHELEHGQGFFNTYEQSKCESERLVRDHFDRFPITIVRPSIVIGDSLTGWTSTFNVIYIPLRLFQRGLLSALPARPETLLDLVPVDWVNDVTVHLIGVGEAAGKVCHLTAGPSRAVPLGTLLELASAFFGRRSPLSSARQMRYLSPEEFDRYRATLTGREWSLMDQLGTLLPYVTVNRLFDSTTTDALLQGSGIRLPRFESYAERIFEYCVQSNWGKAERGGAGG